MWRFWLLRSWFCWPYFLQRAGCQFRRIKPRVKRLKNLLKQPLFWELSKFCSNTHPTPWGRNKHRILPWSSAPDLVMSRTSVPWVHWALQGTHWCSPVRSTVVEASPFGFAKQKWNSYIVNKKFLAISSTMPKTGNNRVARPPYSSPQAAEQWFFLQWYGALKRQPVFKQLGYNKMVRMFFIGRFIVFQKSACM